MVEEENILFEYIIHYEGFSCTTATSRYSQPEAKGEVKIWISEKQDRYLQCTIPAKYENDPDTFTLRYPSASL